jgi:hypothetical protein
VAETCSYKYSKTPVKIVIVVLTLYAHIIYISDYYDTMEMECANVKTMSARKQHKQHGISKVQKLKGLHCCTLLHAMWYDRHHMTHAYIAFSSNNTVRVTAHRLMLYYTVSIARFSKPWIIRVFIQFSNTLPSYF